METSRDHAPGTRVDESGNQMQPVPEEFLRTRCPSCQKLYAIDPIPASVLAAYEKSGEQPMFQCTACLSQFAIILPLNPNAPEAATELVGVAGRDFKSGSGSQFAPPSNTSTQISGSPERDFDPKPEARSAPSAAVPAPMNARSSSTDSGKIDPEAEQIAAEMALGAKPELILLWKDIIENYEIESKHDAFIQACAKAGALPYAAHRYGRILAEFPDEEIARKMRLRLVQVATAPMEMARSEKPVETPSTRRWSLNAIIIMLGTAVALIGQMIPDMKNMTKIGVAMMALAFGIRFFSRRSV